MADNDFNIRIVTTADPAGMDEAKKGLKEISNTATEGAKQAVAAEAEVTKATKETFASKKQLKDMMKEIGHEFPLLGSIGRLALNPIAFVTAGLVAAFSLWKQKVDDLTVSLGGIKMADVKEEDITRVQRLAAAYADWAKSAAEAATQQKQIKSDLQATVATIKANADLMAAMGLKTGTSSTESEANAKAAAANKLEADARARLARAGKVASPEAEASVEASYKKAADQAVIDKAEAQKRKDKITDLMDMSNADPRRVWGDFNFRNRYGYGTSYREALDLEQSNISSQDSIINRYGDFERGKAGRAVRRKEVTEASGQLDEVAALRAEVLELRRRVGTGNMGAAMNQAGNIGSGNIVGAMVETAQTIMMLTKALNDISRANKEAQSAARSVDRTPK